MKVGVIAAILVFLTEALRADGGDWMRGIDGGRSLAAMSIPGTHDAGARFEPVTGTAKCQELTISQQLAAGVRFLDIRCRHRGDSFRIHHGAVDQRMDFTEVQDEVFDFLRRHPGETVIMSVKEEHRPEKNTRGFTATFEALIAPHQAGWWLGNQVPRLREVRGKVVLFRRFRSERKIGIDATDWPDNTRFEKGLLRVQDRYRVPEVGGKWQAVEAMLLEAGKGAKGRLTLNFTSGYVPRAFGIPDIRAVSGPVNQKLAEHLRKHPGTSTGVVVMDFITPELASAIYRRNR